MTLNAANRTEESSGNRLNAPPKKGGRGRKPGQKNHSTNPEFLTIEEAAFQLGVSGSLVRRLYERKKLQGFKIGGTFRIVSASVRRYLEQHSNLSKAAPEPTAEIVAPMEGRPPPRKRKRKGGFPDYYVQEMERIESGT